VVVTCGVVEGDIGPDDAGRPETPAEQPLEEEALKPSPPAATTSPTSPTTSPARDPGDPSGVTPRFGAPVRPWGPAGSVYDERRLPPGLAPPAWRADYGPPHGPGSGGPLGYGPPVPGQGPPLGIAPGWGYPGTPGPAAGSGYAPSEPYGYGASSWYGGPVYGAGSPPQIVWVSRPRVRRPPRHPPRHLPGWLGVALVAALAGSCVSGGIVAYFASRAPQTVVREYFPSNPPKVTNGDVQAVLARVLPAVVSIDTSSYQPGTLGDYVEGAGTGMIIQSNGIVLTNNHVIAGASTIGVTLYGQTASHPARVIGTDPSRDIALIQIEGTTGPLPTVIFGDSGTALQGDGVIAIGNALALAGGPTVTEGIVSAENRSLTTENETGSLIEHLTGLIQTDAPINPGNSGGPLVNAAGDVIAMNTAVAISGGGGNAPAQNVGFAIAMNSIRPVIASIMLADRGG
jgi:S1-C subfamily serine protease